MRAAALARMHPRACSSCKAVPGAITHNRTKSKDLRREGARARNCRVAKEEVLAVDPEWLACLRNSVQEGGCRLPRSARTCATCCPAVFPLAHVLSRCLSASSSGPKSRTCVGARRLAR